MAQQRACVRGGVNGRPPSHIRPVAGLATLCIKGRRTLVCLLPLRPNSRSMGSQWVPPSQCSRLSVYLAHMPPSLAFIHSYFHPLIHSAFELVSGTAVFVFVAAADSTPIYLESLCLCLVRLPPLPSPPRALSLHPTTIRPSAVQRLTGPNVGE
eukprot:GHVU01163572.1.p1 GENE.GHVU01163572.1~~GHVU01163572.1.p1  ORF type:complete len:154 (+),score=1.41 GHVU01163572.1:185-646(+)